ncbi:MAG: peptide-methionine (R)-S-oxide reductase MsrB [Firmicutes bacterium]|jgi:peptide-methionine (R)-S-oxide reductase|nr:peptide-methionine (R)-S-oxide reductase MsrB [Bacillota bacterium]
MATDQESEKGSDKEWQNSLTAEQFYVLRQKGTEAPFTGKYNDFHQKGFFVCAACGNSLFSSDDKYDSGSGWPSFTKPVDSANIDTRQDTSHNMLRTEALCTKCGSHLGHVFEDGPGELGQRWCINSVSLEFMPKSPSEEET